MTLESTKPSNVNSSFPSIEELHGEAKALEEDIKTAVDKGKKTLDLAGKKVMSGLNKHILGKVSIDVSSLHNRDDASNTASGEGKVTFDKVPPSKVPAGSMVNNQPEGSTTAIIDEEVKKALPRPKIERDEAHVHLPVNTSNISSLSHSKQASSATTNDFVSNSSLSTEMILAIYTLILSAYHAWARKSDILANQIPLSVVVSFVVAAFLLGYNMNGFLVLCFKDYDDGKVNDLSGRKNSHKGGMIHRSITARSNKLSTTRQVSFPDGLSAEEDVSENTEEHVGITRLLMRRGRSKIKRVVSKTSSKIREHSSHGQFRSYRSHDHEPSFFSNLSRDTAEGIREFEARLKAPFAEGPLMDHLLKNKDFARHRSRKIIVDNHDAATGGTSIVDGMRISEKTENEEESEHVVTDITMGNATNAKLKNVKASSLEADEKWSHIVDPLCEFRGMDFFLTDDPDEGIWRQPFLNECGLRDVPTVVSNMMMPMGNMTTYFKLPDWFDDWDNIPEEKEDDPCEVKALKRFLLGDNEYRKARAYLIPYIVNGPLAIRLIRPPPIEVHIHGPRHPSEWKNVPKSVDPAGKKHCPLLEVDIDLISNKEIRRCINIIRPHLPSITVDLAFVISKPKGSEVEEPSACLGLWRVDKVDFERCAVIPEKTIEEAADELKLMISKMGDEGVPIEVAAG